jgi:hypothetical protein
MNPLRRYEILLPLYFNDARAVPDSMIREVLGELRHRFHAITCESQVIRGAEERQGEIYRDNLIRVIMDVPDTEANCRFFSDFKTSLKIKFDQKEIWMITHPIDVV